MVYNKGNIKYIKELNKNTLFLLILSQNNKINSLFQIY